MAALVRKGLWAFACKGPRLCVDIAFLVPDRNRRFLVVDTWPSPTRQHHIKNVTV